MNEPGRSERPLTADELVAELRLHGTRRDDEAVAMIKAIHAAGPTLVVDNPRRFGFHISRGPGAVARRTPDGLHAGWYRVGQRTGRPSKMTALDAQIEASQEEYFAQLRKAFSGPLHAERGRKSGQVRREEGLVSRISEARQRLVDQSVRKYGMAKQIARELDCSVYHCRRVLRQLERQ